MRHGAVITVPADVWLLIARKANLPQYSSPVWGAFYYDRGLVSVPYWFWVSVAAALAGVPWIKWSRRFNLRTLFIVMTLIAAILGIVAMSS